MKLNPIAHESLTHKLLFFSGEPVVPHKGLNCRDTTRRFFKRLLVPAVSLKFSFSGRTENKTFRDTLHVERRLLCNQTFLPSFSHLEKRHWSCHRRLSKTRQWLWKVTYKKREYFLCPFFYFIVDAFVKINNCAILHNLLLFGIVWSTLVCGFLLIN